MQSFTGNIVIEGKGLVKEYRMGTSTSRVLDKVSLQISESEFVSFYARLSFLADYQSPNLSIPTALSSLISSFCITISSLLWFVNNLFIHAFVVRGAITPWMCSLA